MQSAKNLGRNFHLSADCGGYTRFTLETSSTCHDFSNGIGCNPYAYLLYDSVWALISKASLSTGSVSDSNPAPSPFHSQYDSSRFMGVCTVGPIVFHD